MAYDAARRVIVLFGGDTRATGALGDTWTFDGRAWRQAAMDGPPRRTTHHMVFDRARARVVLFGGVDGETMLGDTWEWDGTSWMRSSASGPTPRALFGLAYDAARQRTVLFGGTPRLAPDVAGLADTWEYDGTTWARIDVEGPSARDHVAMDFDHVSNQVVLHGGGLSDENKRETWRFDGARWEHVSTSGPPRRYARLLYDPVSQALLLYGGFDRAPSNELWRLTGTRWQRLPE